jgi:hypothetical protein
MLDTRYVSNETAGSVNALIQFIEKLKNYYKLEQTAIKEFDKLIIKIMNENIIKHEAMVLKLA